ncbi:hypothetical protein SESBI_30572 [Sesbania bispinosa]|nr:hypothetical protein SESBI_30572 [Sesbania bispinosa]
MYCYGGSCCDFNPCCYYEGNDANREIMRMECSSRRCIAPPSTFPSPTSQTLQCFRPTASYATTPYHRPTFIVSNRAPRFAEIHCRRHAPSCRESSPTPVRAS